jgi:hypothetical protein
MKGVYSKTQMRTFDDIADSFGGDTYHNRYSADRKHNKKNKKFKRLPKKCARCGSTKNLDIHHPSGDRKNLKSRTGLIVLCRSCHRKLHNKKNGGRGSLDNYDVSAAGSALVFGAGEILDFEDIDFSSSVASKEFISNVEKSRQKDLMYLRFKYVHGGTNGNKDHFLKEELKKAEKTPINKPFNWEHGEPNIGVIYDSRFVDATEDEREHLEIDVAVWKRKYRHYAQDIYQAHSRGELFTSMEVLFTEISCPESMGERYPAKSEDTGEVHPAILNRFKEGSKSYRILHNLCFSGGAKVKNPADSMAGSVAIASKNTKEKGGFERMDEKTYSKAEFESAVNSAVEKAVAEWKRENETAQAIEIKANEIAGLKEKVSALEGAVAEAEEKAAETEKKYLNLKEEISKGAKLQERLSKLVEAKYVFADSEEEQASEREEIVNMTDKQFEMLLNVASVSSKASEEEDSDSESDSDASAAKITFKVPVGATFKTKDGKSGSYSYLKILEESLRDLT